MTDQTTSSAPGGTPSGGSPGNTSGNTGGGSFMRERTAQMAETMARPPMPPQSHGNSEDNIAARNASAADARQPQPQQQEQQPAKIRVGDGEFTADELQSAIAAKAEADILKNSRPKSEAEFAARNSETFKLPEGVSYEFNERDPALAAARKFALTNNLTQEQFSGMLDLFVATQVGGLMDMQQARQKNLDALGAAIAPQRIDAVARWLNAKAGSDGRAVADFIKQYPSAPFVKAVENLIRQFSSQGGADFSQSHRAQEEENGKIPGYENMSFVQKRAIQMAQMLSRPGGYRGGGRRE